MSLILLAFFVATIPDQPVDRLVGRWGGVVPCSVEGPLTFRSAPGGTLRGLHQQGMRVSTVTMKPRRW